MRLLQSILYGGTKIIAAKICDSFQLIIQWYWRTRLRHLGRGARIYSTVKIYGASKVAVGDRAVINDFVHIWGSAGVNIGADTLIAAHTVITSQSHSTDAVARGRTYRQTSVFLPVEIGRNVWIGSNVTILPGISIGDNSIIGAGAVVTRDLPSNVIAAGIPARVLRSIG